ncbi:uncharacterized protein LOC110450921 isoform X2 [Mizuhopecten yessoensis]|uniref:E3 ubiquitin-protein ligase n=2 Tax=Mizuhopecten yessoensis TaxID=6573 RepID=A0A210QMW5_MIZYE|nr:uncharacterized protein LOC110450921 isoform X2 [Mizuhopecten yessoensis]XP_021354400.1 uncharacterized protein LOC110450921 isoform X2 [Mizuhopecten yessoensis]OWF50068.1 E3 ubiquitin-protein ligase DTX3L [Mizuhopecten yessoensis]
MSSTRPTSGKEMGKSVHKKKESLLAKVVSKKKGTSGKPSDNSETDSNDQQTTGSTVRDKTNIPRENVSGSKSTVVTGHETTRSDTINKSKTCHHPKNQDSRASLAIHGSNPVQEPDHTEKLESHEEQRHVSSATATSASNPENGNGPSVEASPMVKDSKTKSRMSDSDKSVRVLVKEQDSTPKESKPKMNRTGIVSGDDATGTVTDLSNTTSEKEQGKRTELRQASTSVDTKSKVRASVDDEKENSKGLVNSSDDHVLSSTNCGRQLKPSSKGSGNGDASSGEVKFSSSQTSQSKPLSDLHARSSNAAKDTSSMTAKHESKQQTTFSKPSDANLRGRTEQENASSRDPNSPSSPPTQSLSDNHSRKAAKPDDHGGNNSKHPPCHIFVNPTKCEITELEVDVVVSSEDTVLQGYGMVAKQLMKKGGERYQQHKEMACFAIGGLKEWHFMFTPGAGNLKCKNVVHVNIPRLQEFDQETWCRNYTKLICRLLKRVDCMGFRSMAIPLLGTGRNGAPTSFVIDLICNQILDFSQKSTDKIWLQTIYIVHPDRSTVKTIETVAKRLPFCQTPEVTKTPDVRVGKSKTGKDHFEKGVLSFIERYSVKQEMVKSVLHEEQCPICIDKIELKERVELNQCHHVFCLTCIKQTFVVKPACPVCNIVYGIVRGIQPEGCMVEVFRKESLPGFDGCGIIHIYYAFPDGIQDKKHPNPGRNYRGTNREAFLPDNQEGQKVHRLLRKSFEQKLTFTIGSSRTTGREDVVTWNDIHHKTRMHGGPERFGYPDPSYLKRVEDELAAKGISEATDPLE